jgi:hypothetical protein
MPSAQTEGGGTDSVSSLCQQFKRNKTGYHLCYVSENNVDALTAKFNTPLSPSCCVMFRGTVQRYYCLLLLQQMEVSSAIKRHSIQVEICYPVCKPLRYFEDYERPRCM